MKHKTKKKHDIPELDFDVNILEPDKDDLLREWKIQPKLYFQYAEMLAKARTKLDRADAELKVVKAEVDRKIRDEPAEYRLKDNPTEASIASAVLRQKEYRKSQSNLILAQERVNILEAFVKALDHRKSALENIVRLHGQQYFATPVAEGKDQATFIEEKKNRGRK